MQIYPAIDIKDGRAVLLRQGLASEVTDYGAPAEAAINPSGTVSVSVQLAQAL